MKFCRFDSRWGHWSFSLTWSFRPHCYPGVESASNRNEYQEYFLGNKGGRCVGLTTLPSSCASCIDILMPQPPGILWVCNRSEQGLLYFLFCFARKIHTLHVIHDVWGCQLSKVWEIPLPNEFTQIQQFMLKRDSWFLEEPRVSKKMDSDNNGEFCEGTRHKKVEKRSIRKISVQRRPGRGKKNKNKRPSYRKLRKNGRAYGRNGTHWSLKWRNSQHAYVEVHFIQTAFIY